MFLCLQHIPQGDWFCPDCRPKEIRTPRKGRRRTFSEETDEEAESGEEEMEEEEEEQAEDGSNEDRWAKVLVSADVLRTG